MVLKRFPAKSAFFILFLIMHPVSAFSQTASPSPEPYTPDEFPEWAQDIRRAEVVSIGSFPLSYLLTTLVFDIGKYVGKATSADELERESAPLYAPLFFGNAATKVYSEDEKKGLLLASVGVSIGVALLDFIIGEVQKADARNRENARKSAGEAAAKTTIDPGSDTGDVPDGLKQEPDSVDGTK